MSFYTHTSHATMTRAMALNLADWQASSVRHFGVGSSYTDSIWWRQPGGSGIYLAALIHDNQQDDAATFADLRNVAEVWGDQGYAVYDCWGNRDLAQVGLRRVVKNPWYLRHPAPAVALDLPEGLEIEIVKTPQQLADFERASWEGFEEPDDPITAFDGRSAFSQHPVETLADAGMYYLNARMEDKEVAGVIIHATADMLGVYGISTLPRWRRHGYASALMRAATALRPDLPMSVFPDPESLPIYSVLGFTPAGEIGFWLRDAQV